MKKEPGGELTWLDARSRLAEYTDVERAGHLQKFFKTERGGYGEGDRFIGLRVPDIRSVEKGIRGLPLPEVVKLLRSEIHEERLLALLLLVSRYERGDDRERQQVYEAYLANRERIDNWDLVDASAPYIFGRHVFGGDDEERIRLAKSSRMWDRRIAMVSTLYSIRQGETAIVSRLAELLIGDRHDLMHKAIGWMLREAGKRDPAMLTTFLEKHAATMPRTTLRYAIERLPEEVRRDYMGRRAISYQSSAIR